MRIQDYLVYNEDVRTACMQLQSIIIGELSRRGSQYSLLGAVANDVLREP